MCIQTIQSAMLAGGTAAVKYGRISQPGAKYAVDIPADIGYGKQIACHL